MTVHISAYQSTTSRSHWSIKNWWIITIMASMLTTSLKICVPSKTWLHTTNHAMTGLLTTTKLFTQPLGYSMVQMNQTKEGTQLTIPKLLPNRNEERFKQLNSCSYRGSGVVSSPPQRQKTQSVTIPHSMMEWEPKILSKSISRMPMSSLIGH